MTAANAITINPRARRKPKVRQLDSPVEDHTARIVPGLKPPLFTAGVRRPQRLAARGQRNVNRRFMPRHHVAAASSPRGEGLVANKMAERVVDQLDVVDVDEDQRRSIASVQRRSARARAVPRKRAAWAVR
jgi:hypothetical protein